MIYLDNSATTHPKPPQVIRAVNAAMQGFSFNPGRGGYRQSIRTAEKVYDARTVIKDFFHAPGEESVIFTGGCTQSLNTVIKGVLRRGDHVIISSLEHNAVVRPLQRLSDNGVISYSVVPVAVGDDDETLNRFRNAINTHTKMMICTHASNVFGFRLPTERMAALAHQYGLLFCLDAAQSAGILPIDMEKDGYDFVCCPGHKYLYGPMGIGLLLIGNDNTVEPLIEGGTGSVSSQLTMPDFLPDRLEAGTLNIPGILGLKAGVEFVSRHGIKAVYEKEARIIRRLRDRLSDFQHIELYTNPDDNHYDVPVLSFNIREKDSESVARFLSDHSDICVRSGLHCAPLAHQSMHTEDSGTVRISPSVFTSDREAEILVNSLRKIR